MRHWPIRTARRRRHRRAWSRLGCRLLRLLPLLVLTRTLAVPAPDRPVVRATVLFALQIEARNVAKDVEPGCRVAADLDLRLVRTKRVEGLIEQIADHARLRLVASRPHIVD